MDGDWLFHWQRCLCVLRVETRDRLCLSYYRPTQCLPFDDTDDSGPAKLGYCYCNSDYCNSATVDRITTACLALSLTAYKLIDFCY